MSERTPVLVDCDTGVDDAWPFCTCWHTTCVAGCVTTVFGNIRTTCAIKICAFWNSPGGPTSGGNWRRGPLVGEVTYLATHVHGADGLGDAGLPMEVRSQPSERDAAALIDDMTRQAMAASFASLLLAR